MILAWKSFAEVMDDGIGRQIGPGSAWSSEMASLLSELDSRVSEACEPLNSTADMQATSSIKETIPGFVWGFV